MSSGESGERLDAALRYAAHGWPVFPCIPGEKAPVTRRGFLDASTDPERISSWWGRSPGRNVAIATGAPGPDVVDVDQHGEAGNGFAAWNRAKREGLVSDPRAIVRTPSGGMHAYFAGTDQRSGKLTGQHLDFRAQGGYVVAPPSAVAGRRYEVVQHQPSDASVDFSAIRSLLDPQPEKPRQAQPRREGERPRDLMHLAAWVAAQPEGNRNDGLFWAASRAAEAGDTGALEAIGRAAQSAGLDEREVTRTIRSAQRGAESRPFAEREREAG
jgi:hypothetical protein